MSSGCKWKELRSTSIKVHLYCYRMPLFISIIGMFIAIQEEVPPSVSSEIFGWREQLPSLCHWLYHGYTLPQLRCWWLTVRLVSAVEGWSYWVERRVEDPNVMMTLGWFDRWREWWPGRMKFRSLRVAETQLSVGTNSASTTRPLTSASDTEHITVFSLQAINAQIAKTTFSAALSTIKRVVS